MLFLLKYNRIFLRIQVYITYNYPSVRLLLFEETILPARMYQISLFAMKSINQHYLESSTYRIFLIKCRGHLFKTRPHRPSVYSWPGGYLLNAFFSHPFLSSVLEVY